MARKAISSGRARRNVRIAQMAGLALGVSAAALWALQVPGLDSRLPDKPALESAETPGPEQPAVQPQVLDGETLAGTAERLAVATNIKPETTAEAGGDKPATQPAQGEWKYIAPIHESTRTLAVLSRNGKQKVLAPGREWEYDTGAKARVIAVDDSKVILDDQGTRREIERASRSGASVQWKKVASNSPAASTGQGAAAMSVEAQMAARGIEGSQAQKMREVLAAREAKRRAQAGEMAQGVLAPEELRELGLSEQDIAGMSPEALRDLRVKYNNMAQERMMQDASSGGSDAASGAPH